MDALPCMTGCGQVERHAGCGLCHACMRLWVEAPELRARFADEAIAQPKEQREAALDRAFTDFIARVKRERAEVRP